MNSGSEDRYPGGAGPWLAVALLLLAYAISFLDRQILSLLVEDLRDDLRITDTQIGLLQGPAFGIFYAVMGLPFGWLADRMNRVRLIVLGMLLWTIMTVLGGFSESFGMLFVTRMGVGVGEAALVPAAVSLLADSFAPARRALPLAIFTAGVSVGAGLALVLGSALIAVAQAGLGGWFEDRAVWQIVLVLAGALGIPVAFAILMLRDPAPVGRVEPAAGNGLLPYLRAYPRLFALMLGGSSLLYVLSYSVSAWMPTLFVREFGWTPQVVGLRMGLVILAVALIGNIGSGLIANRLTLAGRPHGALLTMTTGAFLLIPAALLAPLAPSAGFAQAGFAGIYLAIALCFGVATASFVAVTPPRLRGRMAAIYLSLGNLIGMGIGPPLTGLILQEVLGSAEQVGIALALVTVPTAIAGALLLRSALALHRRRAAELLA